MLAVAALLLGAGSLAVASIDDPADHLPPAREVTEAVVPASLAAQADTLAGFSFSLYRSDMMRGSDTVESLFARLGINDPAAAAYLRADPTFRARVLGRGGQTVVAEKADIKISQGAGTLMPIPASADLAEIVKALNALGASAQDLIGILQAIKAAGALKAELEII